MNHAQGKLARETPYWVPVPIIKDEEFRPVGGLEGFFFSNFLKIKRHDKLINIYELM